jgi:hypothetical protein
MLTLLASIVGFAGSVVPEIFKFLRDKSDKAHELKILEKQIENAQLAAANLQEVSAFALDRKILYRTYRTNIKWVDALNGTVRPVLAYGFFILYLLMKCAHCFGAIGSFIVEPFWTENDYAIFAGITSFYFGQRTFNKLKK